MNYLRLAIAILLAAFAQHTYADSIPTFHVTQATMVMFPNDGSGDNVVFTLTGPGVRITGDGGMGCIGSLWCTGQAVPDTSDAFPSEIFLSSVDTLILAGVTYDASSLVLTNGFFDQNGGLNASAGGLVGGATGAFQFNLTLPTGGSWGFDFAPTTDQFGNPAFSFTQGSFSATAPLPTPELGTIGLMLTGLVGIGGIIKRKKTFRH